MRTLKGWITNNKVVAALAIFLIIEGVFYLLFAHRIVESIYKEESFELLNQFFSGRDQHPLSFYIKRTDRLFIASNALGSCIVLALYASYKQLKNPRRFAELLTQDIKSFIIILYDHKKNIIFLLSLSLLFYVLYLIIGARLIPEFYNYNFFGADHTETIPGWTSREYNQEHKGSHPLILLMVDPLAILLYRLTFSPEKTVVILNCFFGFLAILAASTLFWLLTKNRVITALLTAVLGLSMSHLVFSTLPETYALASCSAIATYVLFLICLANQKIYYIYWIIAGLFSFGVTITNFSQTVICFTALAFTLKKERRAIAILEYVSLVVFFAFILSVIQWRIFPNAKFFFLPETFEKELNYVRITILNQPFLVIQELLKNFFLVNFVAPSPFGSISPQVSSRIVLSFFNRPLEYSFIGYIGAVLWVSLFIAGCLRNMLTIRQNIFLVAVSFSILFNMALHSFFGGNEMFLYSCNFTFLILLLAVNRFWFEKTYFRVGVTILIFLMATNNLMILKQIISG
ncbi:hypothetical protein [Microseira wollei]|uniref:Glycosyltransferase RgtA/B/C/D-like domain-containing protein n=1 Tax=Microseira wollei NIES-4236 TaxID=2530354 RepID=A0AAV3XHG6_9CYAN|nr:hypothetical protein [Microseira wollei]GET40971.1 hypothetical protein MiSe_57830 [Microseira wollei NIES-4236]